MNTPPNERAIEAIRAILINNYSTTLEKLSQRSRKSEIVYLRQCVQAVLARNSLMTLVQIGKVTGNRHYTTVIHASTMIGYAEEARVKYNVKSATYTMFYDLEQRYLLRIEQEQELEMIKRMGLCT